jgi:hypothetical protein
MKAVPDNQALVLASSEVGQTNSQDYHPDPEVTKIYYPPLPSKIIIGSESRVTHDISDSKK